MTYDEWELSVDPTAKRDPTWHVQAYRLGLYAASCAWHDSQCLAADPRGASAAQQLTRAAGSIAATIAEGYVRRSAKDRIRYYEYALGSVAEVRAWYLTSIPGLAPVATPDRFAILLSLTRLLLTMIRTERNRGTRPAFGRGEMSGPEIESG